ncbi:MAG: hypothetical protein V4719_04440 [Planctomycetota bacterium]
MLVLCLLPARVHGDGIWVHPDSRFADLDQALVDDDFSKAQKLLSDLRSQSRKTNDLAFQAEITLRGKEIAKMARDYEKVTQILKSQQLDDLDPKSAVEVGKYYCGVKADWSKGLPLLMKGADSQLAAAAAADNLNPKEPELQIELADKWLEWVQKKNLDERATYQLRARHWLMLAGSATRNEKTHLSIQTRLKQIPLYPERIVVWNTHNDMYCDRGAEEFVVSLLSDGKVVWQQTVPIAWKPNNPSFALIRPPRTRADQIQIRITKHHGRGGGLGEIQVFARNVNLAELAQPVVDGIFESKDRFGPAMLIDGDVSGASGFWICDNGKSGSASIHFQQFPVIK